MNAEPRLPVRRVRSDLSRLYPSQEKRYREILSCLAQGLNEKEIAKACGVGYDTIKKQVRSMHDYFGTATLIEMVLKARREWNLDL